MNVRRTRLVTGLILLSYLSTHLLNHSLGLISLDAMEWGRQWFLMLWRNPVGTLALYGALLTHLSLAFWALYQRRHLRMALAELLQLLFGLTIPVLLSIHIVGTRLNHELFGVDDSYTLMVMTLWHVSPMDGLRQSILVLVAWTHGCIGFHYWLRLKPWYSRFAPYFLALALLLPVLGLLGFVSAGREVSNLIARQPDWIERFLAAAKIPPRSEREIIYLINDGVLITIAVALALALLARVARSLYERRIQICIIHSDGKEVLVPRGFSVLEASRLAGIPHASVCGGRGRCSTCRIRVSQGLSSLPQPSASELRVLQRVGAAANVRLACQLRPTTDVTVTRLLPADAQASDGYAQPAYLAGQERTIAVLFADLRTFTGIAEHKLPYDLVFLLNRYFESVGAAITEAGGIVDKFIGDGVMALFGVDSGPQEGCRHGLSAAKAMVEQVDALSRTLAEDLDEPLRIGIGIHCGPAVVGRMGYGSSIHLTAIGDTVNVASRLQDLTKEFKCQLVISEEVARQSGVNIAEMPRQEVTVRNR
ncbi:MAG TPA: adenylate/guanylate cyclase domain-containing protein, partial [Candidatus Limnocylindrales bacterium]|nr:adenylate/guanylate cyclase domain-containing protein [Candidatus Limnocylindrales bacterium]